MTPLQPLAKPSTMIMAAGYDQPTQTLRIQFKEGSIGDYKAVPPEVADGFFKAASAGRYLLSEIKGAYEYEQVPQEPNEPKAVEEEEAPRAA